LPPQTRKKVCRLLSKKENPSLRTNRIERLFLLQTF
jgi:hypothetical protein